MGVFFCDRFGRGLRRLVAHLGCTSLLLSCVPLVVGAQMVRGRVTDEAALPVARAMVLLLDSTMSVADRVVTNERGDFQVRSPLSGTHRLRVVRIGFMPALSDRLVLADRQTVEQSLVVSSARVQLTAVSVQGRRSCGRAAEGVNDAERLGWEQAMASMATISTSASAGFIATTLVVQRELDGSGRRVRSQQVRTRTARVSEPWRSLPVDSLRRYGYVLSDETDSLTFVAPSVDVLLSESFLEDHCIEAASSQDPSEIGVAFTPAPNRRYMAEVRGVLWLSRESAELRRLDFSYVNVPGHENVRTGAGNSAGGQLDFTRLDDGTVVITNWEIRVPQFTAPRANMPVSRVVAVNTLGGRTLLLRRNRDTLYHAPLVNVAGEVRDSASEKPIVDATVSLAGTSVVTSTDERGRFVAPGVLPGEYVIEAWTDSLALFGVSGSAALLLTEHRDDVVVLLPTVTQAAQGLCMIGSGNVSPSTGVIIGTLHSLADTAAHARSARNTRTADSFGAAPGVANVQVVADWNEISPGADALRAVEKRVEAFTSSNGAFVLCGVPFDVPLSVRALPASGRALPVVVRLEKSTPVTAWSLTIDAR